MQDSAPARCLHGSRGRKARESPLCAPFAPHPKPLTTSPFAPLFFTPPPPLRAAPRSREVTHPIPRSQDHQVFLVTKDFVNASKESAADKAAVITKMAAKAAAKQVAAEEQAENKQKAEIKKAKMTKDVAEDAASAQATKEEVPVQIWPGTISDRGPSPGWALLGRLRPHHRTPSYPPWPL